MHFRSAKEKWAYFLKWVKSSGATTEHLQHLVRLYPNHKYIKQIRAELERRRNASKV